MTIKFIVFDFDGVFSDGRVFYLPGVGESQIIKSYNVKDGLAVKSLASHSIATGLISGHNSQATMDIAQHLGFQYFNIGNEWQTKYEILSQWRVELGLKWSEIAYIGDDINDIECLDAVGFSGCPADAYHRVFIHCQYVCQAKGGEGAVREFIDHIMENIK